MDDNVRALLARIKDAGANKREPPGINHNLKS